MKPIINTNETSPTIETMRTLSVVFSQAFFINSKKPTGFEIIVLSSSNTLKKKNILI